MKILITGATGFLGYHTAAELSRRGHSLIAYVRKTSNKTPLEPLNVQFIEGSLPDCRPLREALNESDVVLHIAGAVKAMSRQDFYDVNAGGTANLVHEVLNSKPKPRLFLHVSTIAVHNPMEGDDFCLPPKRCHPLSHYGISKLAGEKKLGSLKGRVQTVILRPPVLYGPRDREMLPFFKAVAKGWVPLYGRGDHQLSLCYISDVARCLSDLAEHPPSGDKIFCLDDGDVHSWRSVAEAISSVMAESPRFLSMPGWTYYAAAALSQLWAQLRRKPEIFTLNKMKEIRQKRWVCGTQKLNTATGWIPKVKLEEGMISTFNAYKTEGIL